MENLKNSAVIYKCLNDCVLDNTVMFSDFVAAASDEIIKTRSTCNARKLKSPWKKWVSTVAERMNITVDYNYDNWHIIDKRLQLMKVPTNTSTPSSDDTVSVPSSSSNNIISTGSTNTTSGSSKKSTLGIPLSDANKNKILEIYDLLDNSKKWCLSSGRSVEEVMRKFCESSNYIHPANSLVLDLEDDHWSECFTKEELHEINAATERQTKYQLPQEMKSYLDAIPESDHIDTLFDYLNEKMVNPCHNRGLYFLKTTLMYSLDLFRTSYLPLTDQDERDIMRRIWIVIDWVFDGSDMKVREDKGSFASKSDKNKKRKIAAITPMIRQRPSDIPDLLIYYDRYEFCSVEAGRIDNDDTKQKNDSSKLAVHCKQMLLNLSHNAPSLQQSMSIVGICISGMNLIVYELSNPKGMVCVNKKVDDLYFPVHIMEWRKKMIQICEKLWIIRLEIEDRFRSVCTSSGGPDTCNLTPCFHITK